MIFPICNDDELHTINQIKRFEKAANNSTKVLTFNHDLKTADFCGSNGEIYTTTLSGCSCVDFALYNKPCKHMYMLAIDLGLIDTNIAPWNKYKEYSKLLNSVKKKLNILTIKQLQELSKYIDNISKDA